MRPLSDGARAIEREGNNDAAALECDELSPEEAAAQDAEIQRIIWEECDHVAWLRDRYAEEERAARDRESSPTYQAGPAGTDEPF